MEKFVVCLSLLLLVSNSRKYLNAIIAESIYTQPNKINEKKSKKSIIKISNKCSDKKVHILRWDWIHILLLRKKNECIFSTFIIKMITENLKTQKKRKINREKRNRVVNSEFIVQWWKWKIVTINRLHSLSTIEYPW